MEEKFEQLDFFDGIGFATITRNVIPLTEYVSHDEEEGYNLVKEYSYKAYKTDSDRILLHFEVPLAYPEVIGFSELVCPACSKDRISIVLETLGQLGNNHENRVSIQSIIEQLKERNILKLLPYGHTSEFFRILSEEIEPSK